MIKDMMEMASQVNPPRPMAGPPFWMSSLGLVLRPIPAMAMIIKNLEICLK